MLLNTCQVKVCQYYNTVIANDRRQIFMHYAKHLRCDINQTVKELGICKNPYFENKWSLINAIIDSGKGVLKK